MGSSDDLEVFEKLVSGPWTPDMARKMPWDILVNGPQLNGIDSETRSVIELEKARRIQPLHTSMNTIISSLALIVAIVALFRT